MNDALFSIDCALKTGKCSIRIIEPGSYRLDFSRDLVDFFKLFGTYKSKKCGRRLATEHLLRTISRAAAFSRRLGRSHKKTTHKRDAKSLTI